MEATSPTSIADRDAILWNNGPLLDYAYYYEVERYQFSPLRKHKVSEELLIKFRDRVEEARGGKITGRLPHHALGELGEYFAAIMFGIALHTDPKAKGSDGIHRKELVEIKTITPIKKTDFVRLDRSRDFVKIVVVKITPDFQFGARMVHRSILNDDPRPYALLSWDDMIAGCGERMLEAHRNFPMPRQAVA